MRAWYTEPYNGDAPVEGDAEAWAYWAVYNTKPASVQALLNTGLLWERVGYQGRGLPKIYSLRDGVSPEQFRAAVLVLLA
jgi:hypothetical protein